ncbi:MAG: hypothetical protein LBO66_01640 [Deltaproteobacteria bacterium]|jgi:hypothetical protein|nr:hypothetical protein [Deltaproteobacteria bacterium]
MSPPKRHPLKPYVNIPSKEPESSAANDVDKIVDILSESSSKRELRDLYNDKEEIKKLQTQLQDYVAL